MVPPLVLAITTQIPQCRHTEMQAVDNVGTAMFVGEIKAELHRHPF
jgi:hypothetical protein